MEVTEFAVNVLFVAVGAGALSALVFTLLFHWFDK